MSRHSPGSPREAGVAAPNWSTCATWFDYDNDGKLDLFVSSFVQYSASGSLFCGDNKQGRRYYCIPRVFKPRPSFLFHNEGNGKFSDVSKASGIANALGNPAPPCGLQLLLRGWSFS